MPKKKSIEAVAVPAEKLEEEFPNRYEDILQKYDKQIMEDCWQDHTQIRSDAAQVIVKGCTPRETILELGAGQGGAAEPVLLASKNVRLHLLDVSLKTLMSSWGHLEKYLNRVKFIPSDAFQYLQKSTEKYRTIYSQFTVHNFPAESKQKLFKAVCDKLPVGGRFILVDKIYPDDAALAQKMLEAQNQIYREKLPKEGADAIIAHEDEDYNHPKLRTTEGMIKKMLQDAGFSSIQIFPRIDPERSREIIIEAVK